MSDRFICDPRCEVACQSEVHFLCPDECELLAADRIAAEKSREIQRQAAELAAGRAAKPPSRISAVPSTKRSKRKS